MVQGQTKPVYKSAAFVKNDPSSLKQSQFEFKKQERKEIPKMSVEKKANAWGRPSRTSSISRACTFVRQPLADTFNFISNKPN